MVKDRFHGVLGLFEIEHCVSGQQNPEHNGKRGCAQISAHPCESVASTLDGHNFLAQKCWLKIWLSNGQFRNGPFWFLELLFSKPVCNRNAWGLHMARAWNCVLDVFCGIYKNLTFWTKSRLFLRPSMAGFMAGNG